MFGFKIIKVQGHSMEPALKAGSFALVIKSSKYKTGDVVLFKVNNTQMIKRVTHIENNMYFLTGDNGNDSLDSRTIGWIKHNKIYGKVILK